MDTLEARVQMYALTLRGREVLEGFLAGSLTSREAADQFRRIVGEARPVLTDAGYPAEAAWRALQSASAGFDAYIDPFDASFWSDTQRELQEAEENLERLVSARAGEQADFRIIG
ncbi:MAG: hypothetical protein ACRDFX_04600 [Chloroflexota bacterium]